MTQYWPEAIVYEKRDFGPNDCDKMFTTQFCDTLEEAKNALRVWEDHYHSKIILSRIARYSEAGTEYIRVKLNMGLVKDLWQDFGDVPMDPETERIEERWGPFYTGTHREDIWKWFEKTFEVSVAEDLMGHEKELIWDGNRFEIVNAVPAGYCIWSIGDNMCEGFLPLCKLKRPEDQPFDGAREIEPDTLKAIRTDGSKAMLYLSGSGIETVGDMEKFIEDSKSGKWMDENWKAGVLGLIEKALPYAKQIKWEGRE